jgi:hypothetical protein
MEKEKITEIIFIVAIVAAFLIFGQSVGWRVLGVAQLVFTIRVLKEKKIGVGWEDWKGFKPSFYLKGIYAILIGIVSLAIAIILLIFPEETVMKLGLGERG